MKVRILDRMVLFLSSLSLFFTVVFVYLFFTKLSSGFGFFISNEFSISKELPHVNPTCAMQTKYANNLKKRASR